MESYQLLWIIALVIGFVVIGVVAFLLNIIRSTASDIDSVASKIWTQGKLTANNTIQIPIFLSVTNKVVGKIYKKAVSILEGTAALKDHANGCPGCPHCVLQHQN